MKQRYFLLPAAIFSLLAIHGTAQCINSGTGVDGAYNAVGNTTLAGGTYNYTDFVINSGVTVTVTGSAPLIIKCTGTVNIDGNLVANGNNGTDGVTYNTNGVAGAGVAGGGNGGDGTFSSSTGPLAGAAGSGPGAGFGGDGWSGGGGAGYAMHGDSSGNSAGGYGGPMYGTAQLLGMEPGSGGGGGAGGYDCGAGGGGGGGGFVMIIAGGSITIGATGSITCNGGNGGSDGTGNCGGGGGGSGGAIWLRTYTLTNNGNLACIGGTGGASAVPGNPYYGAGGNGADGRIRFDYSSLAGPGTVTPAAGYSSTLVPLAVTLFVTDADCNTGGSIMADASGEDGPAAYLWAPSGNTGSTESNLLAGSYTVTVTDSAGCSVTDSATVMQTPPPVVTLSLSIDTVCATTGSFALNGGAPAGGTYSGVAVSGSSFDPALANAGAYNVITYTYTDSIGCSAAYSDSIWVDVCTGISYANANEMQIGVLPNPSNGSFTLQLSNAAGETSFVVMNSLGQVIDRFVVTGNQPVNMHLPTPGVYLLRAENEGRIVTKQVIVQ